MARLRLHTRCCCSCVVLSCMCIDRILTTHSPVQKNQQYVSKESLWIPGNAPILADLHKYERYVVHAHSISAFFLCR